MRTAPSKIGKGTLTYTTYVPFNARETANRLSLQFVDSTELHIEISYVIAEDVVTLYGFHLFAMRVPGSDLSMPTIDQQIEAEEWIEDVYLAVGTERRERLEKRILT